MIQVDNPAPHDDMTKLKITNRCLSSHLNAICLYQAMKGCATNVLFTACKGMTGTSYLHSQAVQSDHVCFFVFLEHFLVAARGELHVTERGNTYFRLIVVIM